MSGGVFIIALRASRNCAWHITFGGDSWPSVRSSAHVGSVAVAAGLRFISHARYTCAYTMLRQSAKRLPPLECANPGKSVYKLKGLSGPTTSQWSGRVEMLKSGADSHSPSFIVNTHWTSLAFYGTTFHHRLTTRLREVWGRLWTTSVSSPWSVENGISMNVTQYKQSFILQTFIRDTAPSLDKRRHHNWLWYVFQNVIPGPINENTLMCITKPGLMKTFKQIILFWVKYHID